MASLDAPAFDLRFSPQEPIHRRHRVEVVLACQQRGVDELHYQGSRGSSTRAQKDDAESRTWFASSNSLTRTDPAEEVPAVTPASIQG